LITKYGFTGDEAIAWVRICRKGSIMGPQQKYVIQHANVVPPTKRFGSSLQKVGTTPIAKPNVKQGNRRAQTQNLQK
jgi:hypothetical protein